MSADVLNVTVREKCGKRNNRRLRAGGHIPAVIYGHGQENVRLTLAADELNAAIRHGAKLVELKGGVTESALISDVHWSALGTEILHIDLTRVRKGERVQTTVPLELRGNAPGIKAGGSIDHLLHQLDMDCEVTSIPEKLFVNVNSLQLHQTLTAADIELPADAKLLTDSTAVVVQCVERAEVVEEEAAPTDGAEPEIIGRKAEDEQASGEGGE